MKQRNGKKKIGSLLLAAAVMIGSFPAPATEVHAAELGSAAPGQFVTKEQLKTFNTDDNDGSKNPAKVYFGKNAGNNQEWWIAGSQGGDSVTLFAASPLGANQKFDSNYDSNNSSTATKSYNADWGCSYSGSVPSDVNANHYGASTLRAALKGLETSCFSTAEQALMQETTIYTNDVKNSNNDTKTDCAYSTTDTLYPAYAEESGNYITVGANASDNLNNGLRIEKEYWGSQAFWLRAPLTYNSRGARVAVPGSSVSTNFVSLGNAVVPAFELNLSSVLFASAAEAASSDSAESGTIADGAAMTLRLDGAGKTIGTVSYDAEAGRIVAQKAAGAAGAVSLVVQGRSETGDWYYSMPAETDTVVTKEQIETTCGISDIDLAECKIWLETTEDSVTYAKMADASPIKYATAKQLKGFDTDDTDGKNPAKVYFGKNAGNNQEWWIAGSQGGDSVTLFAASPLGANQKFDSNYDSNNSSTATKSYNADWGCSYSGSVPSDVNANHYGASTLRTALKGLETSCFSTAEQALMQGTTIYTNDTKNSTNDAKTDCAYSTTDKLYPAYAEASGNYITVGENAPDNLNSGLRIDKEYWGSRTFWLRAPYGNRRTNAQLTMGGSVSYNGVNAERAVVPAFELDLSSVLFASAAKAASSETTKGTIADGAAMMLRLDGKDKTIGTVSYDTKAGRIVAQKDAGAAGTVSLVVQGKSETSDWYYSVPAGEGTVVTKEQIETACSISGLNLAECKIWLETTEGEDSFAYAKIAEAKNFNDEATLAPGQTLVRDDETIANGQDGTVTIDKGNDGNIDVTVKLPSAGNVDIDADGTVTVPTGATVQAAGGKELTLPNGGTVDADGKVEAEKIVNGDTTVTAPSGEKVTADKDGKITVPAGGTVQAGDGKVTTLPNGGTVDKDGNISAGPSQPTASPTNPPTASPTNSPTNPSTNSPTNPSTNSPTNPSTNSPTNPSTNPPATTVSAGGTVQTESGKELTLPNGGSVDKDGNVVADKIVNGDTTVTAPSGGKVTADKAGNITVPAGGKVGTGNGKELTLPNGGTVDKDEKVEADKIVSGNTTATAPSGGKVTADKAGNITVPAGGTVEAGDGKVTALPNGGTVDKDGNISQTAPQPTNPPTTPPTEKPGVTNPEETVPPEEVMKNSEKLDSGVSAGWKGNAFRLGWQAVQGAEGYDIFAEQCEKKLGRKSLAKTVKGNKTSVSLTKIAGKKLSGKKNYKVKIKAWKYIGGKKVYIGSSKTYHVAGWKHKKYTNAKKLIPAKKKYTLKKGKNASLKVQIVKQSEKKKLLPNSYGPKLRYFSDNKEVAAVTSKGKVKAKGKGTCNIYVTALNGISVKIKITVK